VSPSKEGHDRSEIARAAQVSPKRENSDRQG
jgi:hypothetical protein